MGLGPAPGRLAIRNISCNPMKNRYLYVFWRIGEPRLFSLDTYRES